MGVDLNDVEEGCTRSLMQMYIFFYSSHGHCAESMVNPTRTSCGVRSSNIVQLALAPSRKRSQQKNFYNIRKKLYNNCIGPGDDYAHCSYNIDVRILNLWCTKELPDEDATRGSPTPLGLSSTATSCTFCISFRSTTFTEPEVIPVWGFG
jgi:hypothetical protein